MHAFRRMPDNADAVYVISIGLVSNGVAMVVLQWFMSFVDIVAVGNPRDFQDFPMLK